MSFAFLQNLINEAIDRGRAWEGSSDESELSYLARVAKSKDVGKIAEIGFNAGFSSYVFLESNPTATVYSFDLGEYAYVSKAEAFMDLTFPGRHQLILGDSNETVNALSRRHPGLVLHSI